MKKLIVFMICIAFAAVLLGISEQYGTFWTNLNAPGNCTFGDDSTDTCTLNCTPTFAASSTFSLGINIDDTTTNASKNVVDIDPAYTGGATDARTYSVIDISAFSPTNSAGTDTVNALKIGALTDPGATITSVGIDLGAGFDTDLSFGDTATTMALANGGTLTIKDSAGNTMGSWADSGTTGTLTVTGDVVLPDSSVGKDEISGVQLSVIFCGDLGNNTTVYTSPVSGFPEGNFYKAGLSANDLSYALAGTGCDAEDSTTEATADEVLLTGVAFKVLGMYCKVTSSGSNGVTLTMRSATADLTPSVTMTIATGSTGGLAQTPTTTDVAAGATLAVKAVTTEDLSAQDFWCIATIMLQ